MKSPFAILLVIAVLIGIVIAAAAIFFFGPTDRDDNETIPIASESELPTPSTRNAPAQPQSDGDATRSEVVIVSTSVITEESSTDELPPEIQERIESGEGVVVITAEDSGRREFGGGPDGGAGGPNFQAIQEAMESNPEIQELFQKAQSGNMSQEDQARLRELMQEALADAGIEAPGDGQGRGFGTPPTQGIISAISGSTITIDHNDDSGLSTDVEITDNTNMSVISQLTPADLTEGTNVAGTVQRGEGGRIFIVNLAVVPEQPSTAQSFRGGFLAPRGLFGTNNDATNLSNIEGTITEINGQQLSVETTQGTLRMTTNDDSRIISTNSGTIADITEGMAAIAFGGSPPNNLVIGPEFILQ
ncbi:MAG: YlbF family regulator [Chloroflexi bacterium]|nr:YlbF family regulator [Chloroflexota bacterium]